MFERLDPPEPFRPDGRFRSEVATRGRRLKRRRHRIAGAALGSLVVAVGVVGVAAVWADRRWDDVQRVEVQQLPETVDALDGEPFNVLVVGLDESPSDTWAGFRLRSDTIIVVRVEPRARTAQIVSIPRDLWLPMAGTDREGRINEALDAGGPEALVGTVESALRIPIDRYLQVDFDGFRELVDAAGGVRLDATAPLRDRSTGLDVPAGCHTFGGTQALALVRSRRLERFVGGQWVDDPTSDLGRTLRQQTFGRAVLSAAGDLGSDPVERARLLDVFADHVVMDSSWTREELEGLVDLAAGLGPDDVSSRTLPVVDAVRGSAQVLLPEGEALAGVIASLRGEAPDPHPGAAESPQHGPDLSIC